MICLGEQNISPTHIESEAAELYIRELFRNDFLMRFPDGIVISQLDYRHLQLPRNPAISEILSALSEDFRRWNRENDYRKCDMMGISYNSSIGEILEVTTWSNRASARRQIRDKLDTLIGTVNRIHSDLQISWRFSQWRPVMSQLFLPLPQKNDPSELIRYLCYQPTYRPPTPNGVSLPNGTILYEIHALRRSQVRVLVPVEIKERMRRFYHSRRPLFLLPARELVPQLINDPTLLLQSPNQLAYEFAVSNPEAIRVIGQLLLTGVAISAIIIAIVTIIDPIPGDEVPATTFTFQIVRLALTTVGG